MTNVKRYALPFLTVIAVLFLLKCSGGKNGGSSTSTDLGGTAGIRNFRQLQETLSFLTGVSIANEKILQYYNSAQARLSMDGNVQKISPAMLLTSTALVGLYCQRFIELELMREPQQRRVHQSVDFAGGMEKLSLLIRTQLIEKEAELFWRRVPDASEIQTLLSLMDEIEKGTSAKRPSKKLKEVLMATCTAVGSSLDSLQN